MFLHFSSSFAKKNPKIPIFDVDIFLNAKFLFKIFIVLKTKNSYFFITKFDAHKVDTKRLLHDKVDMNKVDTKRSILFFFLKKLGSIVSIIKNFINVRQKKVARLSFGKIENIFKNLIVSTLWTSRFFTHLVYFEA